MAGLVGHQRLKHQFAHPLSTLPSASMCPYCFCLFKDRPRLRRRLSHSTGSLGCALQLSLAPPSP
eukprot:12901603-Prorocentrum_lima.AAC.1